MKRSPGLAVAAALFVTSLSLSVFAEPSAEERAAAEALFMEGRDLAAAGDVTKACPKFEKSQALDPQVGTLLYVATCHEQLGQTATAWIEFKDALTQAERLNKADRIQQAKDGIARVEPLLSKVTVSVTAASPEQHVRINGHEITTFDEALPYNPGTLKIEAEAPRRKTHTETVELAKGASITVAIPALVEEKTATVKPKPKPPRDHTLAYIVGGSGLGVVALGFAFGGAAWATRDSADESCTGQFCDDEGLAGHDRATAFAWTSNVLIGAGTVAVGAGVVLFFLWPPEAKKTGRPTFQFDSGGAVVGWSGVLP